MLRNVVLCFSVLLCTVACATTPEAAMPALHVDLPKFMGRWYVIASIPTFIEKNAYNATESYDLRPDGAIDVTFMFHKGSFDGAVKTMHPRGFVRDSSNALWGMQFVWPFKAEYRIAYLDEAYSEVVIARSARDYVWIMARTPAVSADRYAHMVNIVKELGYDTGKLRTVPQRWP